MPVRRTAAMTDNGMPVMKVALLPREQVTFTDGWHVQGLKGPVPTTTTSPTSSCPSPGRSTCSRVSRCAAIASRPDGTPDGRHRRRPRSVGARCGQEHARRRPGTGRHQIPDERHGVAGQPPTFQKDLAHHVPAWRAARLLLLTSSGEAEKAADTDGSRRPTDRSAGGCGVMRPTSPGSARSGRTWRPGPSIREGSGSNVPSGTSTPAPSTPSSARRRRWTPPRSGWDWWRTTSPVSPAARHAGTDGARCRSRLPPWSGRFGPARGDPGGIRRYLALERGRSGAPVAPV